MSQTRTLSSMINGIKAILPDALGPSPPRLSQPYLTGFRGLLVAESFIWLWLQTFVPAVASDAVHGPLYQEILRKVFAVLFWEKGLIFSFFLTLSARTCCIHFLNDPSGPVYARSLITRPLRVGLSISIALALSFAIFPKIDTTYIGTAAHLLENPTLETPSTPANGLAAANSIYNLLWVVRDFAEQEGNQAWPSKTMWAPSLIYFQNYTVYIFMVILPFTRPTWHIKGLFFFSLGSFWFNSWGYFSAAGLFLADVSLNTTLRGRLTTGARISENMTFPYWAMAALLVSVGLSLKYVWMAAFPQYAEYDLVLHPHLDGLTTDGTWKDVDTSSTYPRLDNYLVVVGTLLLLETSERMKKLFSLRVMIYLGKRSLSKHP